MNDYKTNTTKYFLLENYKLTYDNDIYIQHISMFNFEGSDIYRYHTNFY